jgi:serine/threonine-protein kinase
MNGDRPTRASGEEEEEAVPAASTRLMTAAEAPLDVAGRASGVMWALLLLVVVLGGGYAVTNLIKAADAEVEPQQQLPAFTGSGTQLPEFREPGQAPPPQPAGTPAQPQAPASADASKGTPAAEDKESRPARGGQGMLTLIVQPEAEVFRGGRSLGHTPLFSTPLPVGTHRLRIVGADGKKHALSVPIQAGKTAAFRMELDSIPLEK